MIGVYTEDALSCSTLLPLCSGTFYALTQGSANNCARFDLVRRFLGFLVLLGCPLLGFQMAVVAYGREKGQLYKRITEKKKKETIGKI